MVFLHCSICPPYVELNKIWNTSLVPIQWAKPHDATKMPQLLCVKLEDPKKITSQALRRSRAVIHLAAAYHQVGGGARKRPLIGGAGAGHHDVTSGRSRLAETALGHHVWRDVTLSARNQN